MIKDWKVFVEKEMQRVKSLQGPGGVWVECNCEEGKVYIDNCISYVPGIGETTRLNRLADKESVSLVEQLLLLDEENSTNWTIRWRNIAICFYQIC